MPLLIKNGDVTRGEQRNLKILYRQRENIFNELTPNPLEMYGQVERLKVNRDIKIIRSNYKILETNVYKHTQSY